MMENMEWEASQGRLDINDFCGMPRVGSNRSDYITS